VIGAILAQGEVHAAPMAIGGIRAKETTQLPLVEDDHVIKRSRRWFITVLADGKATLVTFSNVMER
jgi:hypothetical protein